MTKLNSLVAASVVLVLATGCSTPPPLTSDAIHPLPPAFWGNGLLVTPTGRTLYTFDADTAGASTCTGDCAQTWTPFAPAAADSAFAEFTIVARDDGTRQWALKGRPLYLCNQDRVMGDAACDKRDKAWHAVRLGT
jgi:predicted lipoprotein with Yx(FWY)xxD motif